MKRLMRFFSLWQNLVGFLIVLLFTLVALTAPLLSPPNDQTQGAFKKVGRSTDFIPHPPGENAILGTLSGQTDVFHALVWGTRDAMIFGLSVALGAFLFGSLFGAIAGYASGAIHNFMMRIADAFLTFPVLAGVVLLQERPLSNRWVACTGSTATVLADKYISSSHRRLLSLSL